MIEYLGFPHHGNAHVPHGGEGGPDHEAEEQGDR